MGMRYLHSSVGTRYDSSTVLLGMLLSGCPWCGCFDLGAMPLPWEEHGYYFTAPTSLEQEARPAPRSLIENLTRLSLFSPDNTKTSHHARSRSLLSEHPPSPPLSPPVPPPPRTYQGSPIAPPGSPCPLIRYLSLRQLSYRPQLDIRYLLADPAPPHHDIGR